MSRPAGRSPLAWRHLAVGLGLGLLVLIGMMVWADARLLVDSLRSFEWHLAPAVLGLSLTGYLVRVAKWELYLSRLHVRVPLGLSALCYVAGMVMSITPGKLGELLRSFLLREARGVPVATTAPILVAERLTDVLALVLLAAVGVAASGHGVGLLIAGVALVVVVVGLLAWPAAWRLAVAITARLPVVGRLAPRLHEARRATARLIEPRTMLAATSLSVIAWGGEGLGTWLVLSAFPGVEVSLSVAVCVFALSTLAGALSMLPGGLGAAEASMVALITVVFAVTSDEQTATAATLLIRFATLWFGVGLGACALGLLRARHPRLASGAADAAASSVDQYTRQ